MIAFIVPLVLALAVDRSTAQDPLVVPDPARASDPRKGPYLGEHPPGQEPVEFAPGLVSQPVMNHSVPTFSPDGREVFWARTRVEPRVVTELMASTLADGTWTAPVRAPFASEHGDDNPFFAPDGQRLYFTSRRPLPGDAPGERENIWFVTRDGNGWSAPTAVGQTVNAHQLHWQFSVAANGNLYFSTDAGLMFSRFADGSYGEPVPPDELHGTRVRRQPAVHRARRELPAVHR